MSHSLKGAEIFDVGVWNGMKFNDADLDNIVTSFRALSGYWKVPLKLGHNKEQKMTDGAPALGWVTNVYRKGTKLVADFEDLPRVVYEAIKKKLYRTVSVELMGNVKHKDDRYPWVLDAVALLGATHPAVNTLEDLNTLLASRPSLHGDRHFSFSAIHGNPENHDGGISTMDKNEVQKAIADAIEPLNEQVATLNLSLADEKKARATAEAERDRLQMAADKAADDAKAAAVKLSRDNITELFEKAVKAEAITPAQRDSYILLFKVNDDDTVVNLDPEVVASAIGFKEKAHMSNDPTSQSGESHFSGGDPVEFLMSETRKFQLKHNEDDFEAAFTKVAQAFPEEHRNYLFINGGE